jgi:hypothetical protein
MEVNNRIVATNRNLSGRRLFRSTLGFQIGQRRWPGSQGRGYNDPAARFHAASDATHDARQGVSLKSGCHSERSSGVSAQG